jgi:2-amino-4-hydroxy-6-hydroxymethyldihydropteridine diphosphokinase
MKNIAYIELGGNIGDRIQLINSAKKLIIDNGCNIIKQSSIYETPPWGFVSDSNFYNQTIKIEVEVSAPELICVLQNIENELGRVRNSNQYEARTMDIDILFFNNEIINKDNLTVPHPRLHLRKFVLIPMNEIEPQHIHPIFNKTIKQLLLECDDKSECKKIEC